MGYLFLIIVIIVRKKFRAFFRKTGYYSAIIPEQKIIRSSNFDFISYFEGSFNERSPIHRILGFRSSTEKALSICPLRTRCAHSVWSPRALAQSRNEFTRPRNRQLKDEIVVFMVSWSRGKNYSTIFCHSIEKEKGRNKMCDMEKTNERKTEKTFLA